MTVLSKGTVVGHYRIVEKIGSGGMGEVYLAEDTELNRQVALKFLSPHLCHDADCRARFRREAQAAAKLSHPGIVTIFEVSEFNGRPFFAMEHVVGQTLRQFISQSDMALPRVIDIAIQLCEGLQEAHEEGVIHRDVKPGNVIVDSKARCRILDFGLANIEGGSRITKSGATLGTVSYMSPEQARGEPIDHRTDLFSLGVVLYEMVTGQLPFKGDSDPAILHAIAYEEPQPVARYRREVTDSLQRVIDKALRKDKSLRYQHADEFCADLKELRDTASSQHLKAAPGSRMTQARRRLLGIMGVFLVVAAVAISLYFGLLQSNSTRHTPLQRQVTFFGDVGACDLSPDGSYMALSRYEKNGARVMVQNLGEGEPLEIGKYLMVNFLKWSPDGTELLIGAWTGANKFELIVAPRFGGSLQSHIPRTISCSESASAAWSPNGSLLAYHSGITSLPLLVINRKWGDSIAVKISPDSGWISDLDWSPSGDRLLYLARTPTKTRFLTVQPDGTDPVEVTCASGYAPRWAPHGDAFYFVQARREGTCLVRMEMDADGKCSGEPTVLINNIKTNGPISVSRDGRALLYPRSETYSNLWMIGSGDRNEKGDITPTQITRGTATSARPSFSPDGSQLAFTVGARGEQGIYTMAVATGIKRHFATSAKINSSPVWSPDGGQIAFLCWQLGGYRVAVMDSSGGLLRVFEKSLVSAETRQILWSPDQKILYEQPGNRNFILLDPQNGSEQTLLTNDTVGWIFSPQISPGGDKIAAQWNRFLRVAGDRAGRGLWVISLKDSSQTLVYSSPSTYLWCLGWSTDGKWIYFAIMTPPEETDPSHLGSWRRCRYHRHYPARWHHINGDGTRPPSFRLCRSRVDQRSLAG